MISRVRFMKTHRYKTSVEWTGNTGTGTESYRSYQRSHTIRAEGKDEKILASSDPAFLGDKSKYNPEDLFLSSLSACHMLWYLHLCSAHKVVVTAYRDEASGIMTEDQEGGGRFTEVTLHPSVSVADAGMVAQADALHEEANRKCFIANSCNFKVRHEATTTVASAG